MKIPIKNPEKVANTIGYIFVSEQNVGAVAHLLEYGVLCIRPEFIGDYLIKVTQIANTIGYIFVSEQNVGAVAHLLEYGVLCIRPDFIGDYLIKVRPTLKLFLFPLTQPCFTGMGRSDTYFFN